MALPVLYARCAGLDVHKKTVVACILLTAPSGRVTQQVRTFSTTTAGLQAPDWMYLRASPWIPIIRCSSFPMSWRLRTFPAPPLAHPSGGPRA